MTIVPSLRNVVAASVVAAAFGLAPVGAQAQQYPTQDVRFICAFPPGSGADVLVRYFAEKVRGISGKTIIVENKSGAAGLIATEYAFRAKPDGHTIFVHAGSAVPTSRRSIRSPRSTCRKRSRSPPPSTASRS
jgi:tripartite-type tricarboxylate transporter receptor subunit TctC